MNITPHFENILIELEYCFFAYILCKLSLIYPLICIIFLVNLHYIQNFKDYMVLILYNVYMYGFFY